jgi:DNA-binding transcriptional regulator YiaG
MSNSDYTVRILAARQKLGIGQRRFAKMAGFDDSTVQSWERGRRRPTGLYKEKLESVLRDIEGNQASSDSRL